MEVNVDENLSRLGFLFGVSHIGSAANVSSAEAAGEKNIRSILKKRSKKLRGSPFLVVGMGELTLPPSTAIILEVPSFWSQKYAVPYDAFGPCCTSGNSIGVSILVSVLYLRKEPIVNPVWFMLG